MSQGSGTAIVVIEGSSLRPIDHLLHVDELLQLRILIYCIRGSITVQWISCFTGLDSIKQVNLL